MSDCAKGGRQAYDQAMATVAREEYIRQLESKVRDLIEFDTNVRQKKLCDLKADKAALSKQLECERDIRARKNARIEKLEIENEELRDLVGVMHRYLGCPESYTCVKCEIFADECEIPQRVKALGIEVG